MNMNIYIYIYILFKLLEFICVFIKLFIAIDEYICILKLIYFNIFIIQQKNIINSYNE